MNEQLTTTLLETTPAIPNFINKALSTATTRIFKIGESVRKSAFEVAAIIATVDESECYKEDGFNTVHEWTEKTFGIKKTASYSLLRIGREWTRAITNKSGKIIGYESNLLPENNGADFNTSQVEKMLPVGHAYAGELVENGTITPDMTCKQIEKIIKSFNTPEDEPEEKTVEEPPEDETEVEESPEHYVIVTDSTGARYNVPFEVLDQYRMN